MFSSTRLLLALLLLVGFAAVDPAGAGKLFTVDCNNNDVEEFGTGICNPGNTYTVPAPLGPVGDDYEFSFVGSTGIDNGLGAGVVKGAIRAVDVFVSQPLLQGTVDTYVDFTGGTPLDFATMDVLIVDVVLFAGSAPIDEIGIAVGTEPPGLNPLGAGYFLDCVTGLEVGCTGLGPFPVGGEIPVAGVTQPAIQLEPGNIFFPGAAEFSFDKLGLSGGNLEQGETSRRLFVTWLDTGPNDPLDKVGQVAAFMISSGENRDFFVNIVPEPSTVSLLGFGLALLGLSRARRSR